eukprot:COSAG05_NODE_774_length_7437_cov_53.159853_6_plen_231_part_00
MTDIYLHMFARMADYIHTHTHTHTILYAGTQLYVCSDCLARLLARWQLTQVSNFVHADRRHGMRVGRPELALVDQQQVCWRWRDAWGQRLAQEVAEHCPRHVIAALLHHPTKHTARHAAGASWMLVRHKPVLGVRYNLEHDVSLARRQLAVERERACRYLPGNSVVATFHDPDWRSRHIDERRDEPGCRATLGVGDHLRDVLLEFSVRPLAYAPDSICPSPAIRSENAKK